MTDFFPLGELIDRYIIAVIKYEKTGLNSIELDWYTNCIQNLDLDNIKHEMEELKQTHLNIWQLESSLRSGLEEDVGLEEIGRRAIEIRNYNAERVVAKNKISKKMNSTLIEYKKDHLSEEKVNRDL
jgi:hypothetical protein